MPYVGPTQHNLLRAAATVDWLEASPGNQYASCLKLHSRGLMDRHPKSSRMFKANEAGFATLAEIEDNEITKVR